MALSIPARAGRSLLLVLGLGLFVLLGSQLHCADVAGDWGTNDGGDSDMPGNGDGGADGGYDGVHCYTGTATSELLLLNHCTDAEHVDRATHIPKTTWDGQSPLPFSM
jgi:hypothetical protein